MQQAHVYVFVQIDTMKPSSLFRQEQLTTYRLAVQHIFKVLIKRLYDFSPSVTVLLAGRSA